eukprot:TRINITY_DN110831_c0_g1_i1.p1 TRINITY_DN110831_c0_g1~~TRINITY_DN110831_c0_g1_i1.p1  ORF type:complete len:570 (+),score=173.74 TRINITY_DN110831_c0_g1_i1:80-1789(+)
MAEPLHPGLKPGLVPEISKAIEVKQAPTVTINLVPAQSHKPIVVEEEPDEVINPYDPGYQARLIAEGVLKKEEGYDSVADAVKLEQAAVKMEPTTPAEEALAEQRLAMQRKEAEEKERKRIRKGAEVAGVDVEDWVALRNFIRPDRSMSDTSWAEDACQLVCAVMRKGKGKGKRKKQKRPGEIDSEDEGITWRAEVSKPQPYFTMIAKASQKGFSKGAIPPAFLDLYGPISADGRVNVDDAASDVTGTLEQVDHAGIEEAYMQACEDADIAAQNLVESMGMGGGSREKPMSQLTIGKLKLVAKFYQVDVEGVVEKEELVSRLKGNMIDDAKAKTALDMHPDEVAEMDSRAPLPLLEEPLDESAIPAPPIKKKRTWRPAYGASSYRRGTDEARALLQMAGMQSGGIANVASIAASVGGQMFGGNPMGGTAIPVTVQQTKEERVVPPGTAPRSVPQQAGGDNDGPSAPKFVAPPAGGIVAAATMASSMSHLSPQEAAARLQEAAKQAAEMFLNGPGTQAPGRVIEGTAGACAGISLAHLRAERANPKYRPEHNLIKPPLQPGFVSTSSMDD